MARKRSPARLVIALSVAAVLAVFLLYTSLAGGASPSLRPSQLTAYSGDVQLAGAVVGHPTGDSYGSGLRFTLRDIDGKATVPVVYTGSVPDLFKVGQDGYLQGKLHGGIFVGDAGTLVTRCPSKYVPKSKA